MSTRPPSRVVFIGNIPYGLSEEQIIEIFKTAGPVERFRLVYDQETGKPKGFGFLDYPDTDHASSAVRNLNDYEIMGRRLRVDFSNEQKAGDDDRDQASFGNAASGNNAASYAIQTGSIPPLPAGKELLPGVKCTDAISQTLNTLPPAQVLDVISQMKALATNEPQRAIELLQQAPQLAATVFQALLLMGLVSPEAISSVVDAGAPPAAPAPNPVYPGYPPPQATQTPPVAGMPYPPPPHQGYGATPVPAPAPAAAPPAAALPNQDELMRQVMALPDDQIALLSETDRQQILALRAQFAGVGR
ncbi:Cleavage stimulation factor subunit-like protein [Emericellopsis cladophorae]|uniref:Cleavage stimulation factor subunit-like protein n=1 Tax=Emericellopsis cladophorae TaxID=2686198 RepID=A0A9P9Y586_9HYPO|nr:Cleavage stimulation factor subunit-like protein [Emericellopsis cladophorae]KAI6783747.1 Cleavage stimulation factor subunit-like protein [Emericellopsis cladophorae]